jgi:hypothetical protein
MGKLGCPLPTPRLSGASLLLRPELSEPGRPPGIPRRDPPNQCPHDTYQTADSFYTSEIKEKIGS